MKKFKLNNKYRIIFISHLVVFIFTINTTATPQVENKQNDKSYIKIDGDSEPASLADIPLPKHDYDLDSFDKGFYPENELIDLLDRPDELTGMNDNDFMLEFPLEK